LKCNNKTHGFFFFKFPEPADQFQSKLIQIILGCRKFDLVQIKEDNNKNRAGSYTNLFKNHWARNVHMFIFTWKFPDIVQILVYENHIVVGARKWDENPSTDLAPFHDTLFLVF
jgi:hypothetical protein